MTFVKEQQAELFAVFLAHFLMMHLVRFVHGAEIGIVQFVQPLTPTMNEHIVQHEIGEAVSGDTKPHPESKQYESIGKSKIFVGFQVLLTTFDWQTVS